MTTRTVKFGWWKGEGQLEINSHDAIISTPSFQTVKIILEQGVSDFEIRGLGSMYPSLPPSPFFAQGTTSCDVDLPAGTFTANCARKAGWYTDAIASITYHI